MRSTNNSGIWNPDYVSIKIKILPAWYQTILFKIALLLSLLGCVFLWNSYRNNRIKKQRDLLKKQVEEKTAEIVDQKDELQAFNEELTSTNEELYNQRKELEAALNALKETQQHLVQAEKMASLGILSAGIAHEINNPLNFINGGILAIESYIKENNPEQLIEINDLIEAVKIGVKRTSDIVTGIRHYSSNDNLQYTECNVNEIIDNCLIMLQNQLKNKIAVEKLFTKKPCPILGNEGKIHQVFLNIISNAEQSIAGNGSIKIETMAIRNLLTIKITDTGEGIEAKNLQKIFDPFFTTKDPGKGTGLGLSITYKILTEHKGTIEIESESGKGTTVIIKLPINNSEKL